ncbi:hypothetical protein Franean1_2991 [Parafrankia sp. EAN1pec]|nr:hypothetical protein Franean1_2991 [Frankia sp. EAN1pec]
MGAGLRDATNLAWKLAGDLDSALPEHVLDTYEIERKPHARALIRLAMIFGTAMTEGGEFGDFLRKAFAPWLHLLPGFKDHILNSQTPALHRSELVCRPRLRRTLAGTLCPNALLDDGRRFDDVAAERFTVVTADVPSTAQCTEIRARGGVLVTARLGTALHRWLQHGRPRTAVIRPDGKVLRTCRALAMPRTPLPHFGRNLATAAPNTASSGKEDRCLPGLILGRTCG